MKAKSGTQRLSSGSTNARLMALLVTTLVVSLVLMGAAGNLMAKTTVAATNYSQHTLSQDYRGSGFNSESLTSNIAGMTDVLSVAWNGSYWLIGGYGTKTLIKYDGVSTYTDLTSNIAGMSSVGSLAWNGSYWLIGGGGGTSTKTLIKYDGVSTYTDLTSNISGMTDVYSAVWNGSYWLIGSFGTKTLVKYDGVSTYTDLTSNIAGMTNVYSAAWNGSYWLIGGGDSDWLGGGTSTKTLIKYDGVSTYTDLSYSRSDVHDLVWNGSYWLIREGIFYETYLTKYDGSSYTDLSKISGMNSVGCVAWNGSYWLIGGSGSETLYTLTETGILAPTVTTVVPSSGPPGTEVTVTGSGFGNSQGVGEKGRSTNSASYVSFNGVAATEYVSWSDTRIVCKVPNGATPGPVTVVVNGQSSNVDRVFTVSYPTWYLAEGTTAWGFDCYVTIENPNDTEVKADITYMTGSGSVPGGTIPLPAKSQATVFPKDKLGSQDFSTKVTCTEGKSIAVDRTMTWTGTGAASEEAHSSVGVTSPEKTWYLPEGSSAWGFECWLLIQNPGDSQANCSVTYMIEGEGPRTFDKQVPAHSRATYDMSKDIGSKDASIKVESDVPVIPERAMYRNNRREGHDSIGTTTPAQDYYLAEGATGYNVGYITYVLVQNPAASATDITITYLTGSGQVAGPSFAMPANSRKTIKVNDTLPPNSDVSTHVKGSAPIIAERAMYWNNGTGEACHDSIGMASPHKTFYLPDGQTLEGRETWTLVQNPNGSEVTVDITYMTPTGTGNVTKTEAIPANSRKTFNMAIHSGINGRASIMVSSKGLPIMVERAMYWNNRGAGTDTIGGYGD